MIRNARYKNRMQQNDSYTKVQVDRPPAARRLNIPRGCDIRVLDGSTEWLEP